MLCYENSKLNKYFKWLYSELLGSVNSQVTKVTMRRILGSDSGGYAEYFSGI
jgi:hypothetical protein